MLASTQRLAIQVIGFLMLAVLPTLLYAAGVERDAAVRRDVVRLSMEEARGLNFHRLSTADGLSQTRVSEIIQDDLGFIWMGTQYGVDRYDGYSFKHYVHEPGNPKSAAGTWVLALFKDHQGFIWIGWNEGVDRLDPRTETFTHYRVEPGENSQRANAVNHISQDREGMIWIATGSGLHRLDPSTGTLSHFRAGNDPGSLPTNDVNWSGQDSRGRFWVGTALGLVEFDRTQGKVLRFISMPDVRVRLFEDREGRYGSSKNGETVSPCLIRKRIESRRIPSISRIRTPVR